MHFKIFDNLDEIDGETFSRLLSGVSAQRQEKVLRFKHREGRVQSLMAYVALADLLREHYGMEKIPEFVDGEHGKPFLRGSDIHFNISHCRNGVAAVVGDSPVGIDIERIPKKIDDSLCRYIFNENELRQLDNSPEPRTLFTVLWTQKESLAKLTGNGLMGSEQIRSLLADKSGYVFHTAIEREKNYVYTICTYKS